MTVSVVIGTYGDEEHWKPFVDRASRSAASQPCEVIHSHHKTLAMARNAGAELATGDWLIFLDADDELSPGYVEAMLAVPGDVRRPSTLGISPDGTEDDEPVLIPRKPLIDGNFIVIGAMVERERFLRLGGFNELPILEDWELWIRFAVDGAEIVDVPDAIYRVNVRENSRNTDRSGHGQIYTQIRREYREFFP